MISTKLIRIIIDKIKHFWYSEATRERGIGMQAVSLFLGGNSPDAFVVRRVVGALALEAQGTPCISPSVALDRRNGEAAR